MWIYHRITFVGCEMKLLYHITIFINMLMLTNEEKPERFAEEGFQFHLPPLTIVIWKDEEESWNYVLMSVEYELG